MLRARKAPLGSSPAVRGPNIPLVPCQAEGLPAPAAQVPRELVQALASGPALALLAPVDSADRVQAALAEVLAEPLRLQASHRAPNVPVRPRAAAGASSIPRLKKAR
jgi:hypothetical protein